MALPVSFCWECKNDYQWIRSRRGKARQSHYVCLYPLYYPGLYCPAIKAQLDKIPTSDIRLELREYGAWSDVELLNDQENRLRILWIACGDITEENKLR